MNPTPKINSEGKRTKTTIKGGKTLQQSWTCGIGQTQSNCGNDKDQVCWRKPPPLSWTRKTRKRHRKAWASCASSIGQNIRRFWSNKSPKPRSNWVDSVGTSCRGATTSLIEDILEHLFKDDASHPLYLIWRRPKTTSHFSFSFFASSRKVWDNQRGMDTQHG